MTAVRPTKYRDPETAHLLRVTQDSAARLGAKPYIDSKRIAVLLVNGVATVAHGLKRKPAGWLFHSILGPSHVVVVTAPDAVNILVTANAVGSCVLEVW